MTEKPLHVKVAEALGWSRSDSVGVSDDGRWWSPICPRYDTDWSATGPLIERYEIHLFSERHTGTGVTWEAERPLGEVTGYGSTPLIAVCNLLLALHDAGKLRVA